MLALSPAIKPNMPTNNIKPFSASFRYVLHLVFDLIPFSSSNKIEPNVNVSIIDGKMNAKKFPDVIPIREIICPRFGTATAMSTEINVVIYFY